jgi:hypothetical protein
MYKHYIQSRINPVIALAFVASVALFFGFFIVKAGKDFNPTYSVELDQTTDATVHRKTGI